MASALDRLVIGYLTAVAIRLAEQNLPARALRTDVGTVAGTIALDMPTSPTTPTGHDATWQLKLLRWEPDTGWSATLNHQHRDAHLDAVVRYLPTRQLAPDPDPVAYFVTAVRADPDTIWASATPPRPPRTDHRLLITHLAHYAPPPLR